VHQFARREIGELFFGRGPAEDGVAMRLAAKARDHVAMAARLRRRLEHRAVVLDDRLVGAAAEPPLELPAMGLLVGIEPWREPERQYVFRCHHRGRRPARSAAQQARRARTLA
jgi:hypothetical protein